jgi:nitrate reductase delta subunit
MLMSYRALGLMLTYPTEAFAELMPAAAQAIEAEALVPRPQRKRLVALARGLASGDLYERQSAYVDLFDRTRSLSLNLYQHVHGESRDRGQAMVELLKLYSSRGLELSARELPDHLPVFLEFLSTLPREEAAALLGEAAHVLEALRERLDRRRSPYARVLDALVALAATGSSLSRDALNSLLMEPDDDPGDLEALDRAWAEEQVTFGPDKVECPKAAAIVAQMKDAAA